MHQWAFICCLSPFLLLTQADSLDPDSSGQPLDFHFTKPLYNVYIPENSSPRTYATQKPGFDFMGIRVPLNSSWDIRYRIVEGDKDHFFKAEPRVVGDFCFLFIRIRTGNNDVLNRERKDKYSLQVRALISAEKKRDKNQYTSDTVVEVTVSDANDLNPLFYPSEYSVTVSEDAAVHQSVVRVVAEDADLGVNGDIYYSFIGDTDQFEVHPVSGVISLSRPIRYQDGPYHELTVSAQDRGTNPKHSNKGLSKAIVKIRVEQANFFAPDITIKKHPQIVENSNADIYAIVTVTDKDAGPHGQIAGLDIVDGDPDGHFRIRRTGPSEFNIEVSKLLDREAAPNGYVLQLRASDRGTPRKESYKAVPVSLADFNDNGPIFSKEIYEVKVSENAPVNTPLIRLKVSDADDGSNGQVFLEIVGGNEGGEFSINADTGMLYTAVELDAESKQLYSLTVSAVDQGNVATRKQSSAKIKIYVEDTNDNDPIFEKREQTVWVDENMSAGTSVTTVHAKDKDQGENAYISYLLANLNDVPFEIDHFSGIIRTSRLLDYESMRRTFTLHVRASDWGLPYRRQTEMQVVVKVRDINDNRPQFEKIDCYGEVSRKSAIGAEIVVLSAIDFDTGSIISYQIVSGNDDGCFGIDGTSGTIYVTCDLNDVKVSDRGLNVTATDDTHFADIARVHFKLVDGNSAEGFECKDTGVARRLTEVLADAENNNRADVKEEFPMMPTRYGQNVHSPEFIDFPVEIKVNESVALGTVLVELSARDRDLGYNGRLVYGISGGDLHSQFSIDLESGELRVIGHLDREKLDEYFLNVTVYDLGKPRKSSSRILPVTVLDVNDNAPKFEKSLASFRVAENASNGTAIFRANATDPDEGENAKVSYSIVTETNDFHIYEDSGMLVVYNALDRERQSSYELRVRATDGGGKDAENLPLFSEALVRITIDDINDNAPKFGLLNYAVNVREDVPVGTVVAVVSALDPDEGPEGKVYYSIGDSDGDDKLFKVDSLSGTIRTNASLDFEERQQHTLIVIANDKGNPSLSSEAIVTVNVVDVNENLHAPQFEDFVFAGMVKENLPVGTFVLQLQAEDADVVGDDAQIEYSIRAGDGIGIFSIDEKGIITTLATLDVETKSHYWITVYAQDRGIFPLFSTAEVYIQVLDENDNYPLSEEPVYYPSIAEESPAGTVVLQIKATDRDVDPVKNITYKIVSGDPEGFFAINTSTGALTTTSRKLNRETQDEYILEVSICDNGKPALSSVARVVVTVDDINDNSPEFDQNVYDVHLPSRLANIEDPLFQVLALDKDAGENAQLKYQFKSAKYRSKFRIDGKTGCVYAHKEFVSGQEYELHVRVTDRGDPPKFNTCKVQIHVANESIEANSPPVVKSPPRVWLSEGEEVGFLVSTVTASDPDNDTVWYNIVGGNERGEFYIRRDVGNVILVKKVDYETQKEYSLNISVSDSTHTVYTTLNVSLLDVNDERPVFSKSVYKVELSEAVPIYTEVLTLEASDKDDNDTLLFSFHSAENVASLRTFILDSITGVITLAASLDRETLTEHILTVSVKDGGTPARKNFARLHLTVHDDNDHVPQFFDKLLVGGAFETAAVGTAVLRAYAVDHDKGDNARLTYSIVSGNVGNVFKVDPDLGTVSIAKDLERSPIKEYILYIKASDHGEPPLSAVVPAHIALTMADNAPPKFAAQEIVAEVYEDLPLFSYVAHLDVRSTSSLQFKIIEGNVDGAFLITPSTGVITILKHLDYETTKFYNLSVIATNMASISAPCRVIVHVLDRNDNPPRFLNLSYSGSISESAPAHSLVLADGGEPLVVKAADADAGKNALLLFDIVENLPRKYFEIDSNTGAVRNIEPLDYEQRAVFSFHVQVSDRGTPKLFSDTMAKVDIEVVNTNDCPPAFKASIYNVTLLLPTYKNITVAQVNATDLDSPHGEDLKYDIIDGNNLNTFHINPISGLITLALPANLKHSHKLLVRVSDGKFSDVAKVYVYSDKSEYSDFKFQKALYEGTVVENSTKVTYVCVVNLLGSELNDHVLFRILNPTDLFRIGATSGVIKTTGVKFDREAEDVYELIVEALCKSFNGDTKVTHVKVRINVLDINDNCPQFVDLPYYGVVSVDDEKGSVVARVKALDADVAENAEVRYELIKGQGELFKVRRESGHVEIKQRLEGFDEGYDLLVAAYDKGMTPCRTDTTVHIKVVNKSMPTFKQQFYFGNVSENTEAHTPLPLSIKAISPLDHDLIYTIHKGNDMDKFAIDSHTGTLFLVDELDYEKETEHKLEVRATDAKTGVHIDVPVILAVLDYNDCAPEFSKANYEVSMSEATRPDSLIFRVSATDEDAGKNGEISYSLQKDEANSSDYFYVSEEDGSLFLRRVLDREQKQAYHFVVVATDRGMPSLRTTAHVWLEVLDTNDNAPVFEEESMSCRLSIGAKRDQFAAVVRAVDPDDGDVLHYAVHTGDDHQLFAMDAETGVLTLSNVGAFGARAGIVLLNVSASDGVYTTFTRFKVEVLPANSYLPRFNEVFKDVHVPENRPPGYPVTTVTATDEDMGEYGNVTYTIHSELMRKVFTIDKYTGKVETKKKLDRENRKLYEILVCATDGGGLTDFMTVRVKVADENDNAPKFLLREYKVSIYSNLTRDSTFVTIRALDEDEGENALVTYDIYEKQTSDVQGMFAIDPANGRMHLLRDARTRVGQVFQFFVRASDGGTPARYSDVPVNVLIMGADDNPPVLERSNGKFFLSENSPVGTVITNLRPISNPSIKFEMVSDSGQFNVDAQGQVSLARPLDFETRASHVIGVLALTNSSPPLATLAEILLQVQDENDHAPEFESAHYVWHVGENVRKDAIVMRVVAHDADQGSNGEVTYNFADESSEASNTFSIDSHTGWVSVIAELDREAKAEHSFYVTASDNGTPKHSVRASVTIKLKDYNDNPTLFTERTYRTMVKEDALPGTVLLSLPTRDADSDLSTPVEFSILSGDPHSRFQIKKDTGKIYVAKSLDREKVDSYSLEVIVSDGFFTDVANVEIIVLDVNDNPPYCVNHRYRKTLSEDLAPLTSVLRVLVVDLDSPDNSKFRYVLSGNGSERFHLHKETGELKTAVYLDREKQSKYLLTAHVHDKDHSNWECSSAIELTVTDVNDNAPIFSSRSYTVSLPEDSPVGTPVTEMRATDADLGVNRRISYSFVDSYNDHFSIDADSGAVLLAKPLDRELKAQYNLTLQAADGGSHRLSAVAYLIVNVQDVNDNPPVFERAGYRAVVPEIDAVGTEVVRVEASSRDIGPNAEIHYAIVGGNEHKKFAINSKTGMITIAESLDFERGKEYALTVQAIDGGVPPLSGVTTVNVTVADCNDNAPVFSQNSYNARVREDARIGEKVLQVVATDLDSTFNGRVSYSIIKGNNGNKFDIDEKTGHVRVSGELDREIISSYVLEILAKDGGSPVLSGQALLNIEIADVNDNPPMFTEQNYTAIVQEDKPIGQSILEFVISDLDGPPNGRPFTFDFRDGNEANTFLIDQHGRLRTAAKFNHKVRAAYLLQVRVFDNGSPPLYSDARVAVKVVEESQYPPMVTPLEVNVNSYLDVYPGGVIGKVYANDQDQYDVLTYSLSPMYGPNMQQQQHQQTLELFRIDRSDGTLEACARLDAGEYRLNVSVSDGKFADHAVVKVNVAVVAEEVAEKAVSIRFRDVAPDSFIASHKKGFARAIRNAMKCRLEDVVIVSLHPTVPEKATERSAKRRSEVVAGGGQRHLDLLFGVRRPDGGFYAPQVVRKELIEGLRELEETANLVVEEIVQSRCNGEQCRFGICQDQYVLDNDHIDRVFTAFTSFVSPRYTQKVECVCKEGYGGDKCDTMINECGKQPCANFQICVPDSSAIGYTCQCPEGYAGDTCSDNVSDCHDKSCYTARNPISFSGKSYSQYKIINEKLVEEQFSLSLRIRTLQLTGNIMYAAGLVDYHILEISNGGVQYRFDLGSGEGLVRVFDVYVSDGGWHDVRLERRRNSAEITVDGARTAHGAAPGPAEALGLDGDGMYFGAEVRRRKVQGLEEVSRGFVGCMDDIRMAQVPIPLHKSGDNPAVMLKHFANLEFSCDVSRILVPPGPCGSQPCLNGGTCRDTNAGFECFCHDRYKGRFCELDTDPCASQPCLFGGECSPAVAGDFVCECAVGLSGKRCEYGRFCSPNPCKHGGVCEEGNDGPLCKCRSFVGKYCEYDLNECDSSPCQNGGTCVNSFGSFHCSCPANVSGTYCATTFNSHIAFSFYGVSLEHLVYFAVAVLFLLLSIVVLAVCLCHRRRRKRRKRRDNLKENVLLNSNRSHDIPEFKRTSKLSNLEVNQQREMSNCAPRPVSYIANSQSESTYGSNAPPNAMLKNLDTLRSYGSAADELENVPIDYVRNLNRGTPQGCSGNHCDLDKTTWAEQMHMTTAAERKGGKNNANYMVPPHQDKYDAAHNKFDNKHANRSNRGGGGSMRDDEEQRNIDSYHWDCSDWARPCQTLPNITEVPGSEILDSSSFHSNESNESRHPGAAAGAVLGAGALASFDVYRNIGTVDEDVDEEYLSEAEYEGKRELNVLDSGNDDYTFMPADNYLRHPNSYLPAHGYNITTNDIDQGNLQSPGTDSDEIVPYGFPVKRNRRKHDDDDVSSIITTLEERHSLLEGYVSNSDVSTNLCEIEDSECETESKPLNSNSRSSHQTAV
ncbi:unnamed protein product [Phaedon cochleariae]|uniref:Uncharacterized protein n=1 Tax=Phaedon cochleariae TaxID=80249 RepID=A0A9N9SKE5_PHACE|nr:unnamed protein product [Phaedon cochleariae]